MMLSPKLTMTNRWTMHIIRMRFDMTRDSAVHRHWCELWFPDCCSEGSTHSHPQGGDCIRSKHYFSRCFWNGRALDWRSIRTMRIHCLLRAMSLADAHQRYPPFYLRGSRFRARGHCDCDALASLQKQMNANSRSNRMQIKKYTQHYQETTRQRCAAYNLF